MKTKDCYAPLFAAVYVRIGIIAQSIGLIAQSVGLIAQSINFEIDTLFKIKFGS